MARSALSNPCRTLAVAGLLLGLAGPGAARAEEPERQTVLLLSAFPVHETGFRQAILETLAANPARPVDVLEEVTGLDQRSGDHFEARLLQLYEAKYATRRVDLIIVVGPAALDFVVKRRFLPTVPVVTCFVPRDVVEAARAARPEITGSVNPVNAPRTLELMLSLFPGTRRIHFIIGSNEHERRLATRAREVFRAFDGRVELLFTTGMTLDEIEARMRTLPDNDLGFFVQLHADASGRAFRDNTPLDRLAAVSRRPIFGNDKADLGHGIVGGILYGTDLAGKASARVALVVLGGRKASSIPVEVDSGAVPMFDWRELRRWGISASRLPPGSVIEFRRPTIWDIYGKEIAAGAGLFALQTALVAGLVIQLRRRRRTEKALASAEDRYRTVADFTHDWEFWQRPDGRLEYVSPACDRVTGHLPEEFRASPGLLASLVEEEDRTAWQLHQQEALEGHTPPPIEYRIRTKDGALRWVEQTSNPVRRAGAEFDGSRGSIRDISARKESDLALKAAYDEIAGLRDRLEAENTYYRERIQSQEGSSEILGASNPLKYLLYRIRQVAPSEATVLILGETGTGKELVADAIHKLGPRRDRPLVKVNCAALPPNLAESELFGHERGAFTGAQGQRKGRFEAADGATLFLDEVGELSPEVQAKLLRVLQDGEFQRVGGDQTLKVDVRVVAATNRDLSQEVARGRFREDLWYRLNVFPITVPPLRDRTEDIPVLAQHFVAHVCRELGRPALDIPMALLRTLQAYSWPGNIRELQNVLERAVLVSEGTTLRLAGPLEPQPAARIAARTAVGDAAPTAASSGGAGKTLVELEREHIVAVLEAAGWTIEGPGAAAERLGMKPSTLRHRMAKLKIPRRPARA